MCTEIWEFAVCPKCKRQGTFRRLGRTPCQARRNGTACGGCTPIQSFKDGHRCTPCHKRDQELEQERKAQELRKTSSGDKRLSGKQEVNAKTLDLQERRRLKRELTEGKAGTAASDQRQTRAVQEKRGNQAQDGQRQSNSKYEPRPPQASNDRNRDQSRNGRAAGQPKGEGRQSQAKNDRQPSQAPKPRRPSIDKQVRFANKTEDIDGLPLHRLSLEDRRKSDAALQALRRNSTHALSAKELQALRSARAPSAPTGGWKDPWRDIKNAVGIT